MVESQGVLIAECGPGEFLGEAGPGDVFRAGYPNISPKVDRSFWKKRRNDKMEKHFWNLVIEICVTVTVQSLCHLFCMF